MSAAEVPPPAAPVVDLAAVRTDEQRRRQVSDLHAMLTRNDKGAAHGTVSNIILVLSLDPALRGLVGFNEFTSAPFVRRSPPAAVEGMAEMPGPYPRPWGRADVSLIQSYIQRVWTHQAGREDTESAMLTVASANRCHPPRDWLNGLAWDGRARLDLWLAHCFGADDTPFCRAAAAKILIAAARHVRQPGCKFDHMLILEGDQDLGKSTCLRRLAGDDWFTDSLPASIESKDMAIALQGIWIAEFAEIEQVIRTEVEVIKAFLTKPSDRFRPPYGKSDLTFPRQCVFFGTTNSTDYLRDSSGNRRFWPIRCSRADVAWIIAAREQLWAEAAARETAGEAHWIDTESVRTEATAAQAERLDADVWTDRIREYLGITRTTTVGSVLNDALFVPVERQGKREQMRVASILRQEGWTKVVGWKDGKTERSWERP